MIDDDDDDDLPEPQACSDPSMVMTDDEVFAVMMKSTQAVRNFGKYAFENGVEKGREEGVAVVAGIIALGIWASQGPLVVNREYWTSQIDGRRYYACTCRGCGCQLKHLYAGEDERTDAELCGVCRY